MSVTIKQVLLMPRIGPTPGALLVYLSNEKVASVDMRADVKSFCKDLRGLALQIQQLAKEPKP